MKQSNKAIIVEKQNVFSLPFSLSFRAAFTLAEILITLGIIGVVAAITIPLLQNEINDIEIKTKVKEAYSIFSQATQSLKNDNGGSLNNLCSSYTNYTTASSLCVLNLYAPYLQHLKKCDTNISDNGCWTAKTFFLDKTTWWTGNHPIANSGLVLKNGMSVIFYKATDNGEFGFIIDINGPSKGSGTDGIDIFEFFTTNDTFIPFQLGTDCSGQGRHCSGFYLSQ